MNRCSASRGFALLLLLMAMVLLFAFTSQSLQSYLLLRQQNERLAEQLQTRANTLAERP